MTESRYTPELAADICSVSPKVKRSEASAGREAFRRRLQSGRGFATIVTDLPPKYHAA